jgi:hypothetical protein
MACLSSMTTFFIWERDELGDGSAFDRLAGGGVADMRPSLSGRISFHFRRVTTLLAVGDHRFTGPVNIDVFVSAFVANQSQSPRRYFFSCHCFPRT